MADLDDSIRDDLARLRERERPSEAARARMWAGIESSIPAWPEDDPHEGEPPAEGEPGVEGEGGAGARGGGSVVGRGVDAGFVAKVAGATLGLTAAGLLALRLGAVLVSGVSPEVQREPDAAPRRVHVEPTTAPKDRARDRAAAGGPGRVSSEEAARSPAQGRGRRESRPAKGEEAALGERERQTREQRGEISVGATQTAATAEPTRDSLAAELALLEQARAARTPADRLAHLEAHRRRFATGQLADERELLRVEALCELGRVEEARDVAERFVGSEDEAGARARMRRACPNL
ncbi:hypothetical protein G6O69_20535 [Pseudenhygromyxa sp. WMMC2535]|uniref:hypothetical protein n=1 Tax=Pseudenhygromyxa sp. WMMC2535 TaxID=2712867 RepID=UPI0015537853|nr:hypothetical protein [Pseudenhygromyxa sp. WMMC2535]NVB40242.1 hypothetical protein [Pseudenhygromyxa sp. WMMC2535]